MMKECSNCGKPILTECDKYIYQALNSGEDYFSCGCRERRKYKELKVFIEEKLSYYNATPCEWDGYESIIGID